MKQFAPSLGRLVVVSSVALGLATVASWYNYRGYWHGTIRRVQTADFNILSHVLPTKLSYVLINQDIEELQRSLNSNYGYFGMIVTDCVKQEPECSNQKILYSTNSKFGWKQQLDSEALSGLPYNTLKNPPPIQTEAGFKSVRDEFWKATENTNQGQIIGRVYYVRGVPPKFGADLADWIKKFPVSLFKDSGADKFYTLIFSLFLMGGLATWAGIEFVIYRKQVHEKIARERQERVDKEKEQALFEAVRLRQELTRREQEISTLIAQREKILAESEIIQDKTQQQARQLEDEIIQTKSKLQQSQQKYERELAAELRAKAETKEMLLAQEQIIAQLQQKQQEKVQISEQLHSELSEAQSWLEELQQDLSKQTEFVTKFKKENVSNEEAYRREIYLGEQALNQAQEELIKTRINNENQKQLLDTLRLDKNEVDRRYQALNHQLESNVENVEQLKQELDETKTELIEQRNNKGCLELFEEDNENLRQENESLKIKIDELEKKSFNKNTGIEIINNIVNS